MEELAILRQILHVLRELGVDLGSNVPPIVLTIGVIYWRWLRHWIKSIKRFAREQHTVYLYLRERPDFRDVVRDGVLREGQEKIERNGL